MSISVMSSNAPFRTVGFGRNWEEWCNERFSRNIGEIASVVDERKHRSTLSTMTTMTRTAQTRDHVLGLIRAQKLPVPDLLRVTWERIQETNRENVKVLTDFLASRAASKDGALAAAAGEALSTEAVMKLLRLSKAGVHKAKDEGRILAYQEPGKRFYLFPMFQFEGSAVAAWIPDLIDVIGNGFAAIHFLTVERKSLKGSSFLKQIQENGPAEIRGAKIAEMLEVARDLAP